MAQELTDAAQKFINSPPGQLVAGAALAGIVWRFFDKVESILSEQTKLAIAVWIVGVEFGQKIEPWPDTFTKVFDRVFGKKHLSWRCFLRSSISSLASLIFISLVALLARPQIFFWVWVAWSAYPWMWMACIVIANLIPDYLSLLETRIVLSRMKRTSSRRFSLFAISILTLVVCDVVITLLIAKGASKLGAYLFARFPFAEILQRPPIPSTEENEWFDSVILQHSLFVVTISPVVHYWLWVYPAFFTSIWLWLYAGAGFLLKAARHFDVGFDFFSRKVDIEKKPLSAIGLVAGVLVALAYWIFAIVVRILN